MSDEGKSIAEQALEYLRGFNDEKRRRKQQQYEDDLKCPRCGGDHGYCGAVRDDEY